MSIEWQLANQKVALVEPFVRESLCLRLDYWGNWISVLQ